MSENYTRNADGTLTPATPMRAGWGLRVLMWWDRKRAARKAASDV